MSNIRQTTFDIVARLKDARTDVEIYAELRDAGAVFGYEAFMIAGLPRAPHENLADCAIISGWPGGWQLRYQERRYMHVDPVIRRVRGTTDPFLWQEAATLEGTLQGMVVFDEARAFGLNSGLCVPFHQLDGSEAGVSFGGARYDPGPDERAGLHLVAIYAMSCAKAAARRRGRRGRLSFTPDRTRGRVPKMGGRRQDRLGGSSHPVDLVANRRTPPRERRPQTRDGEPRPVRGRGDPPRSDPLTR